MSIWREDEKQAFIAYREEVKRGIVHTAEYVVKMNRYEEENLQILELIKARNKGLCRHL